MVKKLAIGSQYYVFYRKQIGRWHVYSGGEPEPTLFDTPEEAMARGRRLLQTGTAAQVRFALGPSVAELGQVKKNLQLSLPNSDSWGW